MCETVGSKRAFASFGKSRKIDGKRTPEINEIWSKMEPGAPKGRLCQGPGPIWTRSEKVCVFSSDKKTTKHPGKSGQNVPRADFVAPADRRVVHFRPRRPRGRLAHVLVNNKKRQTGRWCRITESALELAEGA